MKPIAGPAARKTAWMAAVILVIIICTHLSLWITDVRGVVSVALRRQRYGMWQRSAATGHPWG